MRFRVSSWLVVFSTIVLAACGGGRGNSAVPPPAPPDAPVGLLKLASPQELEASLKAGLVQVADENTNRQLEGGDLALSAPVSDNFTGTYTQEANVDEFDTVRYNGTHLFVANNVFTYCCFAALEDAPIIDDGGTAEASIRILRTTPSVPDAAEVGNIGLPEGVSVQGMYTYENFLIVLTSQFFYGGYGAPWADVALWAPTTSGFRIYDISDPETPVLTHTASFDGLFVESRRIGNFVYIISRYTPYFDDIILPAQSDTDAAANQDALDTKSLADMLPTVTINDTVTSLIAPDACYVLTDGTTKYPVLTSITTIPIDNPAGFSTTCFNDEAYGVYVADGAMYLTQPNYDFENDRNFTKMHKFRFVGNRTRYAGSVEIPGVVWRGGQSDFRMNEFDGVLRVITSEWRSDEVDFVDHTLFTVTESTTAPELTILGELPNDTYPEEIGKPNESLYGVRFLAERAYVVTFQQIDPLYVIDLEDPANPRIAGELEVTGVSDFLHPVSEALLFGLGTSETGAIKLELFNVEDISAPVSLGRIDLGGRGSYSEATYNRHAFTYGADAAGTGTGTDRFTIPAHVTRDDDSRFLVESGLYLFEIRDKNTPSQASLNAVGSIVKVPATDDSWAEWVNRSRAYLHDDSVLYVRDSEVWVAAWLDGTVANGPF
jgi:hypothetical protein